MKIKRFLKTILKSGAVLLILIFTLTGRTRTSTHEQESEAVKEEKLQIGMSFDSFVIERWLRDRDLFELTAKNFGAEVNVQVANGDVQGNRFRRFVILLRRKWM